MKKSMLVLLLALGLSAHAKELRDQSWEFFFSPQYTESKTLEFGHGSKAEINSRGGFNFGFGYNFNANMQLGMTFSSSSGNYKGTRVKEDGSKKVFTSNMYTSSMDITGTYNFIDGPFTPYVTGNFGFTYIDSGVSVEESPEYCYWDPWWGYRCSSITYTDTVLNYGASAGVRYDFKNRLFVKAGVGINYLDVDSTNSADFVVYDITIGSSF